MVKRGVERPQLSRKEDLAYTKARINLEQASNLRFPMLTLERIKNPKVDDGKSRPDPLARATYSFLSEANRHN